MPCSESIYVRRNSEQHRTQNRVVESVGTASPIQTVPGTLHLKSAILGSTSVKGHKYGQSTKRFASCYLRFNIGKYVESKISGSEYTWSGSPGSCNTVQRFGFPNTGCKAQMAPLSSSTKKIYVVGGTEVSVCPQNDSSRSKRGSDTSTRQWEARNNRSVARQIYVLQNYPTQAFHSQIASQIRTGRNPGQPGSAPAPQQKPRPRPLPSQ